MSASTPTMRDGREVVDRLVFEEELVVVDRVAERLFGLDPSHRAGPDLLVEHRDAVAALRLGVVHRRVGLVQHGLRVDLRRARGDRQADARRHDDLAPVDGEGLAQIVHDRARDVDRIVDAGDFVQHDDELVATDPRHRVDSPPAASQSARDLDEQLVAGRVPERVVDRLEAVEVDEQHRGARAVPLRAGERSG